MATRRRSNKFTPTPLPELGKNVYGRSAAKLPYGTISVGQAAELKNILKNEQIRIRQDLQKQFLAQQELILAWVLNVQKALDEQVIKTNREFEKLIAKHAANLTLQSVRSMDRAFRLVNSALESERVYHNTVRELSKKGFRLFVDDSGIEADMFNMSRALLYLGQRFKADAQAAVNAALKDAFAEAMSGLDPDAWPPEYTQLINNQIDNYINLENRVQVQGRSASEWRVYVDFAQIFGGFKDLEEGYHYGALLAGDNNGRIKKRIDFLPYSGQALKNPVGTSGDHVRYQYWYAMWTGQRFYRPFGADRTSLVKKRNEYLKRTNKRLTNIMDQAREHYATANNPLSDQKERINATIEFNKLADELRSVKKTRDRVSQNEDTGIRIPAGKKRETILARCFYWSKKHVAPIWYFLEFGQLKYKPTISPRGVFARFYTKARANVTEIIRRRFNKVFAEELGFFIDPNFQRRYQPRTPGREYTINYTNVSPKSKKGSFLPDRLKLSETSIYGQARRTAQEAEEVAETRFASIAIQQMEQALQQSIQRAGSTLYSTPLLEQHSGGASLQRPISNSVYPPGTRLTKSGRPDYRFKGPHRDAYLRIKKAGDG